MSSLCACPCPTFSPDPVSAVRIRWLLAGAALRIVSFNKPLKITSNNHIFNPPAPSSDVKLKVSLPVIENEKCAQLYSRNPSVKLDKSQMCAGGTKGRDSCAGDSGGPLVVAKEDKW
jgi:Trypsin